MPLTTNATPIPPKLTAERVERGPIVRPEYPTTSMAVNDIMGYPLVKMTAALCVQAWSLQASQAVGWFTPYDAKMLIRLTGNKEMEANQKIVFSLFMAAVQLIRESRLRPRLMDSVFNFTNIGIMISPVPMRQILKDEYQPESELYSEEEWEYPIAIHGMVSGAEEERTRAQEWQELFGKYKVPAFPLPNDRVFHLQSDDVACAESTITAETSGLNDLGTPVPLVIQHFCHTGLSQQAVTQDHPLDNSQTEAHKIYDELVKKYRDALRAVKEHLSSKKSWVELMKLSVMDDGPEVAVDVHLDDPPAQVSSIKTRIKSLATGVWDLLKRLTEYMAPTVVKTPATSATAEVLDPEIDPADFGLSVPENTLITRQHNRQKVRLAHIRKRSYD